MSRESKSTASLNPFTAEKTFLEMLLNCQMLL